MDKIKQLVITFLMLIVYCYLTPKNGSITTLYGGIPVGGNLYFFLLNYFLFAIFSFFIFESTQKYINGYGIFQLVRHQSRKKIFQLLFSELIKYILIIESLKIFCYLLLNFIQRKQLPMYHLDVLVLFFGTIFCMIVFLLIQMLLEAKYSSKISLLYTQVIYILILFGSDICLKYFPNSVINYLFLNNYMMMRHYTLLNTSFLVNTLIVTLLFVLLTSTLYLTGKHIFEEKDIL
ncbi:hypothetical protein NIE88_21255 [Sporolactobacillus shoreicorticis]|uniref:ABC transporter permease n=1 Tax=Sporolactobacillus shoreicorticis TaxID=1923877 RepID=A0ABW5S018_9BACL|nr:hypothetical protein [Sporolactobacillus shoreicorticis]MCO7128260.1 hypothetical protein [Sporolactobacillus shoreicorticis]